MSIALKALALYGGVCLLSWLFVEWEALRLERSQHADLWDDAFVEELQNG